MMYCAVLLALVFASAVECAKILVVFQMPAPSHYILGNTLARGLAEAGHDVTMISPFEDKNPPKNGSYRNIVLTGFLEERENDSKTNNMFDMASHSPFLSFAFIHLLGSIITTKTLNHPNVQKLLKSDEKFDAILAEQFVNEALSSALKYHFDAPLILFSSIGANRWVNHMVANPAPPSYVGDLFLSYGHDMTFMQRLWNVVFGFFADIYLHLVSFNIQNGILKQVFPQAPPVQHFMYNVSLILLNEHESMHKAMPHVPNMISIGGFHVKPAKKLPKDLEEFMDNAKEGVVYFSMGSNLVPSKMPKHVKEILMKQLGSIKQKVLWKWDEELPDAPANFKISKWFPQQDILAHPNTKLFITHGGLLSTTETVYHGIPTLTLPVFGDQQLNAALAENLGYAKGLDFQKMTEEEFRDTLHELLSNPKYTQNAKKRSRLMHDRPIKPLDLAVYWVEHVIRHKDTSHLMVEGVKLPWYKYNLLDVFAFLGVVTLGSTYAVYMVIKKLCCRKKMKDVSKDKKRK